MRLLLRMICMESGREGGTAEQIDTVICSEVLSGYPVLFFKLYLPFPYERNRLLFMFTRGGVYCKTKTGGRGNRCPAAWFVQAYSLYKRVRYFNSISNCSGNGNMPHQEENIFLLIVSIDVECVGIISAAGLRNCAEHTVAFTSGDDSRIIVLILFQVAASVLLDCAGSSGSQCVGGEVPVPFAGRIGRHEDIISVGSVDNIPFELDIVAAGHTGTDVLGPGRNEYDVGPGAGLQNLLGTVDLESTNLELIYMLVVEAGNSDTVVAAVQSTADVVASVCPCASDLICIGSGYCVPVDIAG